MEREQCMRWLKCLLWVFFTVVISISIYYFVRAGGKYDICDSAACLTVADTILKSLDTTIDPCQDFYMYACGSYLENTVLPPNKMTKSHISEWESDIFKILHKELEAQSLEGQLTVFQKAKDFYHSCLDTESIEKKGLGEMRERLIYYGRWPVLEVHWDEDNFNWMETTRKIAENGQNYNMIIGIGIGPNDRNVSQSIIVVGQPEIGIERLSLIKGIDDPVIKAYFKEMVDVAVEFGADRLQAEMQLRESLIFEIQLAEILTPQVDLRDVESASRFMLVSELQTTYPSINWLYLINTVMGDLVKPTVDDYVEVYTPSFIEKLVQLLQKTPNRVLANYMMWQVVYSVRRYLTHNIEQIDHNLVQVKDGLTSFRKREHFCLVTTNHFLTPIMGAEYIRKHFSPHSKEKAAELMKLFQKQLIKLVQEADWLDPITKERALKKVNAIKLKAGYPEELANNVYLDNYFKNLKMNSSDFLGNILRVGKFLREIEMRRLHKPFNVSTWDVQSTFSIIEWNAFYAPNDNSINLYSGILHGFTFDADRPVIFNIATVGSVIGHELTHSVDDMGAEFDELGNLYDWWESDTKKTFKEKANAIAEAYSTYEVKEVNMTLNAKNMKGEIIADEGGVKLAYKVLEEQLFHQVRELRLQGLEDYSPRQVYWLGHAVTECMKTRPEVLRRMAEESDHPPGKFRVNGPLRNTPKFSEDWGCPNGSYMNPSIKVNVW